MGPDLLTDLEVNHERGGRTEVQCVSRLSSKSVVLFFHFECGRRRRHEHRHHGLWNIRQGEQDFLSRVCRAT